MKVSCNSIWNICSATARLVNIEIRNPLQDQKSGKHTMIVLMLIERFLNTGTTRYELFRLRHIFNLGREQPNLHKKSFLPPFVYFGYFRKHFRYCILKIDKKQCFLLLSSVVFSRRIFVENVPDSYSGQSFRRVHFFVHSFNNLN